jgi:hypothetical protein
MKLVKALAQGWTRQIQICRKDNRDSEAFVKRTKHSHSETSGNK